MSRALAVASAFYLPHLVEEALTGMHDDALIVAAFAPLANLEPRHAAYLVFQLTFAFGLVALQVYGLGGTPRRLVVGAFALALLAEAHHGLRAISLGVWTSGLLTSIPLPFVGALLFLRAARTTGV